ncbi:kinase-like protein [Hanseniaspora valbyensis NRRL Y-1626]|uniref:Kinase-like protein n=1 Tax=Hanseniaspora valbyensis NRRL Y-1626 TaxID=766949 RepID=A0A1B7TGM2_9ASCO|nr:kinase-like protein [Hanseniaspora valbyensis NRRL Y-1626]
MDQNNIYNTNSPNKSKKNLDSDKRRNSIIDSINTQNNVRKAGDNSDIDTLPTPVLFIPKRQRVPKSLASNNNNLDSNDKKRVLSIINDSKPVLFNNITNTINTKLDSHPTILNNNNNINNGNKNRTVSIIDTNVNNTYEKKRHISAPITFRQASGVSSHSSGSSTTANATDGSRIYNSTNHYSPTNETNYNLALVNSQYLDYVVNKNNITESTIDIIDLWGNKNDNVFTYKKGDIIGSGNFSDVYEFERLNDGKLFACKYIKYPIDLLKSMKRDKIKAHEMLLKLESSLLREIEILHKINNLRYDGNSNIQNGSQNIIQLVGVNNIQLLINNSFIQDHLRQTSKLPECYIMTDLCPGGNLLHLIKDFKMSISMIQDIFYQVLLALKFLHDNNIIHRDIKLENILLTLPSSEILKYFLNDIPIPKTLVKISDFGLSKQVTPEEPLSTTRCGSPDYIPPEILLGLEYDGKLTDIWSFGVCIYAILEEMLPFDSHAILERQREIALLKGNMVVQKRRGMSDSGRISRCDWKWYYMLELSDNIPEQEKILYEQCKKVVEKCLVRRTDRFNANQLLKMDFFKTG